MPSNRSVLSQKSTRIKQDEKFFSRHLTREVSMSNFSVEDYQGGASVAVPFNWESQPGTPKVKYREIPLPPLTPPPSYYYTSPQKPAKKLSKPNLLVTIFSKGGSRKTSAPSSPVSLSSSSSSSGSSSPWPTSYSVPSSPMRSSNFRGRYGLSSPRLLFGSRADEEELDYESPVSTLCFSRGANGRSRGCYASMIKVLVRDVQ